MALYKNIIGKKTTDRIEENEGINYYAQVTIPNAGHYKIVFGGTSSTGQIVVKITDDYNWQYYWAAVGTNSLICRTAIENYDVYVGNNTTIYCRGETSGATWTKVFLAAVPIE